MWHYTCSHAVNCCVLGVPVWPCRGGEWEHHGEVYCCLTKIPLLEVLTDYCTSELVAT